MLLEIAVAIIASSCVGSIRLLNYLKKSLKHDSKEELESYSSFQSIRLDSAHRTINFLLYFNYYPGIIAIVVFMIFKSMILGLVLFFVLSFVPPVNLISTIIGAYAKNLMRLYAKIL